MFDTAYCRLSFLGIFSLFKVIDRLSKFLLVTAGEPIGSTLELLPLGYFNRRLTSDVADEEIDQYVLTIMQLVYRFVKDWTEPVGVEGVIVFVIDSSPRQHH